MKRSSSMAVFTVGMICTLLLLASPSVQAVETAGCTACPGGSTEVTLNVTFCSLGITYNVDVVYCTKRYAIPQTGLPCTPERGMDEYTVIKRICPSGTLLPPTDAATLKGVYCQLNPLGGDALGIKASIPYCDATPNVYCWLVAFPQCTERVAGCIVQCGTSSTCCFTSVDYCRDRATGDYAVRRHLNCPGQTCASGCTDTGCSYNPAEACEVCP